MPVFQRKLRELGMKYGAYIWCAFERTDMASYAVNRVPGSAKQNNAIQIAAPQFHGCTRRIFQAAYCTRRNKYNVGSRPRVQNTNGANSTLIMTRSGHDCSAYDLGRRDGCDF